MTKFKPMNLGKNFGSFPGKISLILWEISGCLDLFPLNFEGMIRNLRFGNWH